jgi:hypothetical protein
MADGVGKLQCYASYYNANQPNGCTRKINTNWQATTVADFLYDDGAPRPNGMIAFEKFNFTSATTGGFFMHSEWSQGFNDDGDVDQDGNFNEWHQCGVSEDVAINIIKTSDTAMVGDLTFKTKLYQMPGQSAAVFAACATEIASELGDARYKINFTKQ